MIVTAGWESRRGARIIAPLVRGYLRHGPSNVAKMLLYRGVRGLAKRRVYISTMTRYGFRMQCDIGDLIQSYIYFFGVWEPDVTAFLIRRLQCGDVFVDVGAHAGYHTLVGSRMVGPEGRVVAIEASPRIFAELQHNLDLNGATNVWPRNFAAAGAACIVPVFAARRRNTGETTIVPERRFLFGASGFTQEAEVPANTLEGIVSLDLLRRARIVKIDIEGAEGPVLSSLLEHLDELSGALEIVVELSETAQWIERFARVGFHAYFIENDYRFARYLSDGVAPPRRLRKPLSGQTDIVFSRVDADFL